MMIIYSILATIFSILLIIILTFNLTKNYFNSKIKRKEKERIKKIQSQFDEILENLSNGTSKFKTRLGSTVYISTYLKNHGAVDLVYMIDKGSLAIFKVQDCIYVSNDVDYETINKIIKVIKYKHGYEINDVINFFGFILNKSDLEKSLGVKWEDFKRIMNKIYEESSLNESSLSELNNIDNGINYDIDDILDKISRFGINSLTIEERTFLDEYSRD
jgi:hypothetical protein